MSKLHKNPFKSCFISNSSHCSTTILSKHITSALTAIKDHVIKYSETAFSNSNVNYFWSIKNSSEVIEKLRLRNFQGSQVSSFDFSTLYTSLPHDLIKAKVLSLVTWCFNRDSKTYLCTSDKAGFFSNKKYDSYKCWTCAELWAILKICPNSECAIGSKRRSVFYEVQTLIVQKDNRRNTSNNFA